MWRKMPAAQLAKCSEALALRKAFPQEMSGLYSSEEMAQSVRDGDAPSPVPVTAAAAPEAKALPEAQPAAAAKPWRSFKGMIDEFAKLHGRLGDDYGHVYGETLAEFGVKHSNEFKDSGVAIACYRQLLARVIEIESAVMTAEDFNPTTDPEAA
jgi:hypothetical protein